jgi:hypothetical protein
MNELRNDSVQMIPYALAGLRIVSELRLPELAACDEEIPDGAEIVIRRARVPETLSLIDAEFPGVQFNKNEFLLNAPEVGRFLIRCGKEILVDQLPTSSEGDPNGYLFAIVFGVLFHQRGIVPLHASAIDVADGCVAFAGESGAGKSTLVAALAARGRQVIADDVCFLQIGPKGHARAWPGVNRIRLWEDAMVALGCERSGGERMAPRYDKYLLPVHLPPNPTKPRTLRRIYKLHAAPAGGTPHVSRLHGAAIIETLMQNVYRLGLAEAMGYKPAAFVACAAVARDVPVFQFSRPMSFDALRQGVDFLEDHLRDIR